MVIFMEQNEEGANGNVLLKDRSRSVRLTLDLIGRIDKIKVHPRQSYNEVIERLIDSYDKKLIFIKDNLDEDELKASSPFSSDEVKQ